ncbi:helical backbone metal receptor [Aquihabitans sp. McL0605]|uniref:helical backbone metal receptor n=1 Tax=Aquihabitans sp. McL0605 TaxID=3415671 RepID=UPI003CF03C53
MSTAHRAVRVVSLVPSITETLLAWGIVPVACTRFCEQPGIQSVGGTKNPEIADIVGLEPDLVVVNDEENRREDADALVAHGIAVHSCSPRSVADVAPALDALAAVLGLDVDVEPADDLLPALDLRAFIPIWRRPWMTLSGDTYGSSLLASIGVVNAFGGDGDRYPTIELTAVADRGADVVLAPTEPYAFKPFHLEVFRPIAPVVEVDGQDLFWWGVCTPQARRRLHAAIAAAVLA